MIFVVLHHFKMITFLEKPIISFIDWSLHPVNNLKQFFKSNDEIFTFEDKIYFEDLKKENEVIKNKLQIITEENEEFKKQLNFFSDKNFVYLSARVVSRTINPLGTTLIIDRGIEDNIEIGNSVIVSDGIFIGRIIEVEKNRSTVRLINDNNSVVAATIINNDKSLGLLEGGYGLGVRMNYIPQNEVINPGDVIVSSGLTEGIPKGLLIGEVEIIDKQPHEPFQQAVITPLADLGYINLVSVIIKENK